MNKNQNISYEQMVRELTKDFEMKIHLGIIEGFIDDYVQQEFKIVGENELNEKTLSNTKPLFSR